MGRCVKCSSPAHWDQACICELRLAVDQFKRMGEDRTDLCSFCIYTILLLLLLFFETIFEDSLQLIDKTTGLSSASSAVLVKANACV